MLRKAITGVVATLQFEFKVHRTHRKGVAAAQKYHSSSNLRLHLACGEVYKEGWVNIDLFPGVADLCLDLRQPLPFRDNSCEEIYSEHFLEHLSYPNDALAFLSELRRVIRPEGRVITSVPDTEWPMKSYMEGVDAPYFRVAKERYHPKDCVTMMEHLNYHFRQGGEHLFAYDEETLIRILTQAGFTKNIPREFDPAMDSASRHPGSLYVISTKG